MIVAGATLLSNAAAFGHANAADVGWNIEPLAFALLLLTSAIYLLGRRRMNETQRRLIAPPRRTAAYWSAVLVLVLALFSPIDTRSESSFAWHMFQHLLLMLGAGPLFAISNLHLVALFILPLAYRRRRVN